jgi:carboxypeptidase T
MRIAVAALTAALVFAQPCTAEQWWVEAHYDDLGAVRRIAAQFQHLDVDRKRQVVRVDTDEDGIRLLEDNGLRVSIDEAGSARMRAFFANAQGRTNSIPGYACYRTVEETYGSMDQLAAAHADLVAIDSLGPSWQKTQNAATGYAMRALRITNLATAAADPGRPRMVVFGSIHAREYTPAELLARFGEWLVNGYGNDAEATWLVDHVDFRLVLQANPDGRKKAESGIGWRKNTDATNGACSGSATSSHQPGIDLNRNFPFHWNSTAGQGSSGTKCNETYRGPSAASEPEAANLVAYVAGTQVGGVYQGGVFPDRRADDPNAASPDDYAGVFFDIHSYSQLVLWPWGDTENPAPNTAALQIFGKRLAWFNGYAPEQSDTLYPTDGATDDNFYGSLGVPALTMEIGTSFFESCASFNSTTLPENMDALKYAARSAYRVYQLPGGPDALAPAFTTSSVTAGQLAHLQATIADTRYNQSNGVQATYAIRAASAFVDQLPWENGAIPIALQAADGTFNASSENVIGDIDTSGLAAGRHLVYVQGVNSKGVDGTAGTPQAVFLDVVATDDRIFYDGFELLP